jgi:hypothetical protein
MYNKGKNSLCGIILLILIALPFFNGYGQALIADHNALAEFDNIPHATIEQISSQYNIYYLHASHGNQIMTGLGMLESENPLYSPPSFFERRGDLGYVGDTAWTANLRFRLSSYDYDVAMLAWCNGVSDNTEQGINIYLNKMNELESDFPDVTFIYMTGHLDGTGTTGNLNIRNSQIRDYCINNNKALYDFADIESYDPDGNFYPNESDACSWCSTWCGSHSCPGCDICDHSHCFNCYIKAKVFWWMLSQIADPGGSGDQTAPADIVDLAIDDISTSSATLTWQAVGDDGTTGTASQYDIRYSTVSLNPSSWIYATQVSDEPSPQPAGTAESYTVTGLNPDTRYYFAVKTADEVARWSGMSNIVDSSTIDNIPPETIDDLD